MRPSLILISRRRSGSEALEPAVIVVPGAGVTACTTPVPGRSVLTLVTMFGVVLPGGGDIMLQAPRTATAARAKGISFMEFSGLGCRSK